LIAKCELLGDVCPHCKESALVLETGFRPGLLPHFVSVWHCKNCDGYSDLDKKTGEFIPYDPSD
jgi:transposase-like protein